MARLTPHVISIKREMLEERVRFLGLLLFENRLKPESAGVIECLHTAKIRTLMVTGASNNTPRILNISFSCHILSLSYLFVFPKLSYVGDNLLTSITIARECGILKPSQTHVIVEAEQNSSREPTADQEGTSEKTHFTFRLLPPFSSSSIASASESRPTPNTGALALSLDEPEFSKSAETILEDYQMALAGPTFEALQRHRPDLFQLVRLIFHVLNTRYALYL